MRILRCLVQAIAPVACGALVLSLLAGDAMAAKKPPVYLLWPSGANLVVNYYPGSGMRPARIEVAWPIADGADHYRLTVVQGFNRKARVVIDQSPVAYTIGSDGLAFKEYYVGGIGWSGQITVTAYSDPNEAEAYSESLQASIKIP
jgi:hypothetical protein